jgi:hypothetical protein
MLREGRGVETGSGGDPALLTRSLAGADRAPRRSLAGTGGAAFHSHPEGRRVTLPCLPCPESNFAL